MRLWINGVLLLGALGLASCKSSKPPVIEICIGDGVGGADCVERDNTKVYHPPSELTNYWMTNQADMAAFSSWCYAASNADVVTAMKSTAKEIRSPQAPSHESATETGN